MLYELVLSLRQCVYALLGAERTLSWFALLPPIVLILMIVPLVGCGDKSAEKPASARPVRYVVVGSPATLPALERTGEIHAHDETALSFRTAGRMLTRAVDVGDRVNYGQLLATLEETSARNQLDSATADDESARATARVAALNVNRMQKLIATGAIARSQLDSAQADWLVASARVKSSEAALRNARESLGWTRLTSPGEGVITAVSASPGQVVSAGETVVTLAAGQARDVVFDIPDPAKVEAQRAEEFQVALLSDAGVKAYAVLRDISPQADPQTRTWRVRATLKKPPAAMALGASVTVRLPSSGSTGYAIPASALSRCGDKPAVFVITPQMQAQLRVVVLASYTASSAIIASGLVPGDRVITAGVSKLRPGEKVVAGERLP
ncbi:TPA: efflux RND transporter periplasmic adaptor subunit [Klebsiella michiganensis]|uniref:efflux RND transporter periplasmic adaptor subunit n=1 Tax=Klebsiella TaxID=570 RepID=UPI00046A094A|nr:MULTISPECIES: efflux RND transporter periplasmic adaptor subunit [Klebsiella]QLX16147.1 efflux RND transporter periplasmic adaptor subunit [Klebsiella oxytoca]AWF55704.1 efflux transporter, RND family, MFP subunit [Klebsiella michiganensis]EKQ6539690.1 efflux RND transporter periplasmic adaptor subunit [Klebsiella michiganensis]ELQ7986216.1 efflux RND transporter periplasmic adaptor subunit [Klebsiella michiganensis]MBG2579444.1 efflux RND transporter periplasmic adaptor subunit [Klebsiella